MAKNFVQVGENLTLPVCKNVKSGELVQVGKIIGIALTDAKTDDGDHYYVTIATKGVWNLTLKGVDETIEVGGVVSTKPKVVSTTSEVVSTTSEGGDPEKVPVGFALEKVEPPKANTVDTGTVDTDTVVPVLLCLGLAYGTTTPAATPAA